MAYSQMLYTRHIIFAIFAADMTGNKALTENGSINVYPSDILYDWSWCHFNSNGMKMDTPLAITSDIKGIYMKGIVIHGTRAQARTMEDWIRFEDVPSMLQKRGLPVPDALLTELRKFGYLGNNSGTFLKRHP